MARNKSIILSKDEKKTVVASLKTKIAAAKAITKDINATIKVTTRAFDMFVKSANKDLAIQAKEMKSSTDQLAALTAKVT